MNKQIEELANDLRALDNLQYNPNYTANYQRAVGLHSLGYRRQEDVVREIFVAMEQEIKDALTQNYTVRQERIEKCGVDEFVQICSAKIHTLQGILDFIEKFKKKYIGEQE